MVAVTLPEQPEYSARFDSLTAAEFNQYYDLRWISTGDEMARKKQLAKAINTRWWPKKWWRKPSKLLMTTCTQISFLLKTSDENVEIVTPSHQQQDEDKPLSYEPKPLPLLRWKKQHCLGCRGEAQYWKLHERHIEGNLAWNRSKWRCPGAARDDSCACRQETMEEEMQRQRWKILEVFFYGNEASASKWGGYLCFWATFEWITEKQRGGKR